MVHLLNKRYDLTVMGYKYLEIGINVDRVTWRSLWEIIMDTNCLSKHGRASTSNDGIFTRENIYKVRNKYKDNFISVVLLTVRD